MQLDADCVGISSAVLIAEVVISEIQLYFHTVLIVLTMENLVFILKVYWLFLTRLEAVSSTHHLSLRAHTCLWINNDTWAHSWWTWSSCFTSYKLLTPKIRSQPKNWGLSNKMSHLYSSSAQWSQSHKALISFGFVDSPSVSVLSVLVLVGNSVFVSLSLCCRNTERKFCAKSSVEFGSITYTGNTLGILMAITIRGRNDRYIKNKPTGCLCSSLIQPRKLQLDGSSSLSPLF